MQVAFDIFPRTNAAHGNKYLEYRAFDLIRSIWTRLVVRGWMREGHRDCNSVECLTLPLNTFTRGMRSRSEALRNTRSDRGRRDGGDERNGRGLEGIGAGLEGVWRWVGGQLGESVIWGEG